MLAIFGILLLMAIMLFGSPDVLTQFAALDLIWQIVIIVVLLIIIVFVIEF